MKKPPESVTAVIITLEPMAGSWPKRWRSSGTATPTVAATIRSSVIAAVITPSADPISLLALALPMMVFYEVSILIGRLIVGRRASASA